VYVPIFTVKRISLQFRYTYKLIVLVGYSLTLIQLHGTDNRAWRGVSKEALMVQLNSVSLHEESELAQQVDRS